MAAINKETVGLKAPTTDLKIKVVLEDHFLGGARSGYLPPGNYGFQVTGAEVRPKSKGKKGANFWVGVKCTSPEEFKGVFLQTYMPIPIDDAEAKKLYSLPKFVLGLASAQGKELDQTSATINPKTVIGKPIYGHVKDSEAYEDSSDVDWISKDAYDTAPGPQGGSGSSSGGKGGGKSRSRSKAAEGDDDLDLDLDLDDEGVEEEEEIEEAAEPEDDDLDL